MIRAIADEIRGWREALTDRETVTLLLVRCLLVALVATSTVVLVGYTTAVVTVLWVTGLAALVSLLVLRGRGQP